METDGMTRSYTPPPHHEELPSRLDGEDDSKRGIHLSYPDAEEREIERRAHKRFIIACEVLNEVGAEIPRELALYGAQRGWAVRVAA